MFSWLAKTSTVPAGVRQAATPYAVRELIFVVVPNSSGTPDAVTSTTGGLALPSTR